MQYVTHLEPTSDFLIGILYEDAGKMWDISAGLKCG